LYISTGDDTNPFESDGYAPIDNRPGKSGWDARATSANTNDLRGKVLRIKPRADGGYDIPKGNLFSQGTEKTKPEIYVMGCRNPYRISVDSKTGRLFWGEVGPDAGENSEKYGPRGHDEVNMATKAGFYGWPLFVADNRAYARRDFVTKATGEFFNPAKPVNESPHNTGLTQLPPAQKALIYYPYDVSPEFGEVVTKGGRNAMAGPVYYTEDYDKKSKVKFPDYYNGKLFTYDWMRDWVLSVTLDKDGSIVDMERFLPNMPFSHPMDMQFGADGTLYLLEYGPNWFAQNDEARLTRIRFNAGNRAPVVEATLSKTAGAVPFTLQVDASKSFDHDKDALKYSWQMGKGQGGLKEAKGSYTFKEAGTYDVVLTVTDSKGASTVRHFEIQAGNEPPVVDVRIEGNQSFFWEKEPVKYAVNVVDKEDGQTSTAGIPNTDVFFDVQYLEGYDKTMIAQGHQKNGAIAAGKRLIELSDCKSCHALDKKSVGPTYLAIAEKYKTTNGAVNLLAEKIIKGGGGVWGEQAMSAHPQLTQAQAKEMTKYILSLGVKQVSTLPLAGNYVPAKSGAGGAYIFSAVYTDKGASKSVPQTSSSQMVLRPAKFSALQYDEQKGTMKFKSPQTGQDILVINGDKSQIVFKRVDLTGVGQVTMMANSITGMTAGGTIQLRQGSADGKLLGEVVVAEAQMTPVSIPLNGAKGFQDLYLVFVNPGAGSKPLMAVDWLQMDKAKAIVQ
jgi:cytochrome c